MNSSLRFTAFNSNCSETIKDISELRSSIADLYLSVHAELCAGYGNDEDETVFAPDEHDVAKN